MRFGKLIRSFLVISTVSQLFYMNILYASTYDDDVLEIFSKIIPRFILMSSQKQTIQKQIDICILYHKLDERSAISLIENIQKNYPNGIKNYPLKLTKSDYETIGKCQKSQLAFMFNANDTIMNDSIRFLNTNTVLTMSYDSRYLDNGVESTLYLGRKVIPYINMGALRENNIELENTLVQISKIYSKGDGK